VTHVAFLRAINVGGRSIVKMNDLQRAFTTAGAENVRTVIASGNVIFDAPSALGPIRDRILRNVKSLIGTDPVMVFRTSRYLGDLVSAAPFGALVTDRTLKLYVAFLAGAPTRKTAFPLAIPKEMLEVRGLHGRDALIVSRRMREFGADDFGRDYFTTLGRWIDEHYQLVKVCGESRGESSRSGDSTFFVKIFELRDVP